MEHVQDVIDPRFNERSLLEDMGHQVYVEPCSFELDLGNFEPFFGSIALYDIKKKEKISETFHFDLNDDNVLQLLGPHLGKRDPTSTSCQAIFSTSYCSTDIYMLIIFSKILRGEDSVAIGPYINAAKIKDKEKEKYIQESTHNTLRLGKYKQPFGYTVIQLYDENQSLKPQTETVINGLYKAKPEKDVFSWIEKAISDSKDKKKNLIPSKFTIKIKKSWCKR